MNMDYTVEEVAKAVKAFEQVKDADIWDGTLFNLVIEEMEVDAKEMNRLFSRYLFLSKTNPKEAKVMDETMIRFTGWAFNTCLTNAFGKDTDIEENPNANI